MDVFLGRTAVSLDRRKLIGAGAEAEVYDIGGGKAAKVFKRPDHPDFEALPALQESARIRIGELQKKLKQFPSQLPPAVISPQQLLTNASGLVVVGYTMNLVAEAQPMLRYSERSFHDSGGSKSDICRIFEKLHAALVALHVREVVVGDLNDMNILVQGGNPYLIDSDSYQFGNFRCTVFTDRFVDPVLCTDAARWPEPQLPHSKESDWYAFAVMLFRSLLCVDPYGGIHVPRKQDEVVPARLRALRGLTVFNPAVRYPKPGFPIGILSDELIAYFRSVFEERRRGEFPLPLLRSVDWRPCTGCGLEHAGRECPVCRIAVPFRRAIPHSADSVRCERVFSVDGIIRAAMSRSGNLYWLYEEGGSLKREGGREIGTSQLAEGSRILCGAKQTVFSYPGQALCISTAGGNRAKYASDLSAFGASVALAGDVLFRLDNGHLMRHDEPFEHGLGILLCGHTHVWTGRCFGFGFYSAAGLKRAFVFDAAAALINEMSDPIVPQGRLLSVRTAFSENLCWLLMEARDCGQSVLHLTLIGRGGQVLARASTSQPHNDWIYELGDLCAAGEFLFAATDRGLVRIEKNGSVLSRTREFSGTEEYVHAGCSLHTAEHGFYVVDRSEIRRLALA